MNEALTWEAIRAPRIPATYHSGIHLVPREYHSMWRGLIISMQRLCCFAVLSKDFPNIPTEAAVFSGWWYGTFFAYIGNNHLN